MTRPGFGLLTVAAVALVGIGISTRDAATTIQFAAGIVVALALIAAARRLTSTVPEPPHDPLPRPTEQGAGVLLAPSAIVSGRRSPWDVHTRLRPALREAAAPLLLHRRGLELDDPRQAEAVAAVVGPAAWELIRPDRPPPGPGTRRGLSTRRLDAVLRGLEAI